MGLTITNSLLVDSPASKKVSPPRPAAKGKNKAKNERVAAEGRWIDRRVSTSERLVSCVPLGIEARGDG
jgi:hypothetical protein